MLANNTFILIEKKLIKTFKFISKKQTYLLPHMYIKFNDT